MKKHVIRNNISHIRRYLERKSDRMTDDETIFLNEQEDIFLSNLKERYGIAHDTQGDRDNRF